MKKHSLFPICYGIALTAFTVYISLDTFVLRDTYQTDTVQMNTSMFENISVSAELTEPTTEDQTEPETESKKHGRKHHQEEEKEISDTTEPIPEETVQNSSDVSYQDENIQITMTEYYENNTKIYVADIQVTSAEYLKTAFAEDTYGKNVTAKTSSIASAHHAILAINGDYYGAQEKGIVIRNGIVYRDTAVGNQEV